ncbi:MAG: hypothetical protein WC796_03920 [Candidatus Pacearchaeota archaeon]|jgi:hypothetical protein
MNSDGYEIILRCMICEEESEARNLWPDLSDITIYDLIAQSAEMQQAIIETGYCPRCYQKRSNAKIL